MPEESIAQPTSINDLRPKMRLEGQVTRTELYGAFVNLGLEREGMIHISRLARRRSPFVAKNVTVASVVFTISTTRFFESATGAEGCGTQLANPAATTPPIRK